MSRVLLDTQAFLLWVSGSDRLTPRAAEAISDPSTMVLVSAASAWEIAIKAAAGRLELEAPPETYVPDRIREHGFDPLPIVQDHAVRAAALPRHHGAPFDRRLVTRAQLELFPFVTGDPLLGRYDVETIW